MSEKEPEELGKVVNRVGVVTGQVAVRINLDIIRLFSEGLYQSPHKAVEELVSNSYDAGAENVHVVTPRIESRESLWVVDDGSGMDQNGLAQLWQVAYSTKSRPDVLLHRDRRPIGQFGIGKLAAYVLASRVTHISKVGGKFRYVSMDFTKVEGHQWSDSSPVQLDLREVDEPAARVLIEELRSRDRLAWDLMFGPGAKATWTAAALSNFRDLASKLREGTLGWVLSTGLPLTRNFRLYLNGAELKSPRAAVVPLDTLIVGYKDDVSAKEMISLGITVSPDNAPCILIPGLGEVKGEARIYREQLTTGKSAQVGRSNGFFVRVRGRVINLHDELFGLEALNHSAWSRFMMVIEAEGLREFLQSSREGVREGPAVSLLRQYMHAKFNECRNIYEKQLTKDLVGIDLGRLLHEVPSSLVRLPLLDTVCDQSLDASKETYFIRTPTFDNEEGQHKWLGELDKAFEEAIFSAVKYEPRGPYAKLAEYDAKSRVLFINEEHPFIQAMSSGNKGSQPASLFAEAEVLLETVMRDGGLDPQPAMELLMARDRVLRALTGFGPVVAAEAIRLLSIANQDETAMERAVGYAFEAMGLRYTKRQKAGGQDGVVDAKLGLRGDSSANYRAVFDAKTTDGPSVPANQIPFSRIKQFQESEKADFAFVVAKAFDGQNSETMSANRSAIKEKVSLITTDDLRTLLELHLRFGVTLVKVRELFVTSWSVPQTRAWVQRLNTELNVPGSQVPLPELLKTLEDLKDDRGAPPTIYAARERSSILREFSADQLKAALDAVRTIVGRGWIGIKPDGGVQLDQSPDQIVAEVHRVLREDLHI